MNTKRRSKSRNEENIFYIYSQRTLRDSLRTLRENLRTLREINGVTNG